ncbi:MAG: parvulin-like peptidyl-prolyl isomerase [Bacteroidetes bacterium]|jgi:peptidyl-prolyl cis-trans isomerase SurA|nr:parvulin-like peptidyl-prolyl isomerase [Bacteroidota bacterium]MDF2453484.1 parvulin-like peptidyl-prolyl isomerase [Bacteroidota bacterium]
MNLKLAFTFLFLTSLSFAQPQVLDKVVAIVGKNPLLLSEVETNLLQQREQKEKKEFTQEDRCKVFEDVLFQKLLLAQADRDSIVVSDAEVDGELNRRIQYYVGMLGSEEKFEAFYGKRISVFKDELRDDVKNQLLAQKMQQKVTGEAKLTPSEVRAFYNTLPIDSLPLINSELEISHIVRKPPISEEAKKAVRDQLGVYRSRVVNGESMSVIAALYSEDPGSAKNGGRYESVMRGQMVPEFEAVAFRLKAGEVSEIFETSYGYHFMQLVARKGESVDVRHVLMSPKISQREILKAKEELDSIRELINSGQLKFEDAALKFSSDNETKQNGGVLINPAANSAKWELDEIGQMDQNLVFMLENQMKVGDVSPVIQHVGSDAKQAWRIIYLKSRTEPHKANMKDDYIRLLNMATFERQKKSITDWIAKKSKSTYIKIDSEFNSCKLEYNWTITP